MQEMAAVLCHDTKDTSGLSEHCLSFGYVIMVYAFTYCKSTNTLCKYNKN